MDIGQRIGQHITKAAISVSSGAQNLAQRIGLTKPSPDNAPQPYGLHASDGKIGPAENKSITNPLHNMKSIDDNKNVDMGKNKTTSQKIFGGLSKAFGKLENLFSKPKTEEKTLEISVSRADVTPRQIATKDLLEVCQKKIEVKGEGEGADNYEAKYQLNPEHETTVTITNSQTKHATSLFISIDKEGKVLITKDKTSDFRFDNRKDFEDAFINGNTEKLTAAKLSPQVSQGSVPTNESPSKSNDALPTPTSEKSQNTEPKKPLPPATPMDVYNQLKQAKLPEGVKLNESNGQVSIEYGGKSYAVKIQAGKIQLNDNIGKSHTFDNLQKLKDSFEALQKQAPKNVTTKPKFRDESSPKNVHGVAQVNPQSPEDQSATAAISRQITEAGQKNAKLTNNEKNISAEVEGRSVKVRQGGNVVVYDLEPEPGVVVARSRTGVPPQRFSSVNEMLQALIK